MLDPTPDPILQQLPPSSLKRHPLYDEIFGTLKDSGTLPSRQYTPDQLRSPILISANDTVLDGHLRLSIALEQKWEYISCLRYQFPDEGAELAFFVAKQVANWQMKSKFSKIVLALALEPRVRQLAKEHQRTGGKVKGSINLSEDSAVDTRAILARIAGVCPANVDKVKKVKALGCSELWKAALRGQISIDKAYKWAKKPPDEQAQLVREATMDRGMDVEIRRLIRNQRAAFLPALDNNSVLEKLATLAASSSIKPRIRAIKSNANTVIITSDIWALINIPELTIINR
jgi:hypothetical protein